MNSINLCASFILILGFNVTNSASLFQWFGWTRETPSTNAVYVEDSVPLIPIPFEELSLEDKFLQEAKKFTSIQLSQLDSCQHKLIMRIQTSCAGITEEDLAKLSVQLLNCQSEVEGRTLYQCTDKMSLKECTSLMDSDTWNAYHLMNNRARAVCYAARQQQFRALTEMTVNKLMSTAHKQLHSMENLQDIQKQLGYAATTTLATMVDGQKELLGQQSMLQVAQKNIKDAIIHNFNQLKEERVLIKSGHQELTLMTIKLAEKLDLAQKQLHAQSLLSEENHKKLIQDLETIIFKVDRIWNRIDQSTSQLLEQQKLSAVRYETSLKNLERINITVTYLLDLLDNTRSELDNRLKWITDIVGSSDEQVDKTIAAVQHFMFLVLGMIVVVFIQASVITRCALLCLVAANIAVVYYLQPAYDALDFITLTICIVCIMIGECVLRFVYSNILKRKTVKKNKVVENTKPNFLTRIFTKFTRNRLSDNHTILNSFPNVIHSQDEDIDHVSNQGSHQSESSEEDEGFSSSPYENINTTSMLRQRYNMSKSSTPTRTFSRSGTPDQICQALCKNRQPCRNAVSKGGMYCFRHLKNSFL